MSYDEALCSVSQLLIVATANQQKVLKRIFVAICYKSEETTIKKT